MAKKLLILSVSAGYGHIVASKALVDAAVRYFPETEVKYVDILDIMPLHVVFSYRTGYNFVVKHLPFIWSFAYRYTDHNGPDNFLTCIRKKIEHASAKKLFQLIQDYKPDDVICPHFLPVQLIQHWREEGRVNTRVWEVITDYMSHRFWQVKGIDGYFTATDGARLELLNRGHTEPISVTGIPIMPKFGDEHSRTECAEKFGLSPDKTTLLVVGGGAGVGGLWDIAERLIAISDEFQLIVLCGTNWYLLKKLQKLAEQHKGKLFPMGFTNEMEKLLAVSDLVLTKPGGLTISECMAMGKPMVVFAPIPGQEERNSDFLLSHEIALRAYSLAELDMHVRMLLSTPDVLGRLAQNSRAYGKPNAAKDILSYVID